MHIETNATHDPKLDSWVESANADGADFPIQNLPFGVFEEGARARGGVAIGDRIVDLARLAESEVLSGGARAAARACSGGTLAPLLDEPPEHLSALRAALSAALARGATRDAVEPALVPMAAATLRMPIKPAAFTDFCTSIDHIRRMGAATGNPPKLAWSALPVAYNGRASSVAVTGTPVIRPVGQWEMPPGSDNVRYGPEPLLDFELEFGMWLRTGNALGETISVARAEDLIVGCCLVNDWSARGIQFFETMLGPHLGKSFLTTISPWVVTMEALAPFRTAARRRVGDEPAVPAYLLDPEDRAHGAIGVELTATLNGQRIVRTNLAELFWTPAQMIAHQASGGAPLEAGDLVATGTVSGGTDEARACMAEITGRGTTPITLADGTTRTMLNDGDTLVIRGRALADGYRPIGFGDCAGTIHPAKEARA